GTSPSSSNEPQPLRLRPPVVPYAAISAIACSKRDSLAGNAILSVDISPGCMAAPDFIWAPERPPGTIGPKPEYKEAGVAIRPMFTLPMSGAEVMVPSCQCPNRIRTLLLQDFSPSALDATPNSAPSRRRSS